MTPGARKLAVTVHVASSLGWFGAVAVFLALAVTGLVHPDAQMVRAAYLSMEVATRAVIVPLAFGTLASGAIVALGTRWGLLRHYWVIAKLAIALVATGVLLLHTRPIERMAHAAAGSIPLEGELRALQIQLAVNAGAALLALLTATALAVYKPRGITPYGRRKLPGHESRSRSAPSGARATTGAPRWVKLAGAVVAVLLALFVLLHLAGRGLGLH